ncbi:hypothetical protein OROGR_000489 [Orobanche gracilis]
MEGDTKRQLRSEIAVIEEWNGTASSNLTKTATITVSVDSIQKSAHHFNHLSRRILDAFVPEIYRHVDGPCFAFVPISLCNYCMLGSISRSFTGVASGATRAALTQHFALQNNAADISAKEGSQETVATMVGMALGMLLAHITMGHSMAIWFCFLSLTIFHMSNYKAVRCLSLATLNCERSSILLSYYMETGQVPSPEHVSVMEHVLPRWMTSWRANSVKYLHQRVRLDVRISSLSSDELAELSRLASSCYNNAKYMLLARKSAISIVMHRDSTTADGLQAFMHALVLAKLDDKDKIMHTESQSWMAKHYEVFVLKLRSLGWRTERLLSASVAWKANWFIISSDEKVD